MRITSGIYRGRELVSPKTQTTHPMGSRERLALFNTLQSYLKNATVLDAYAGTGALGLEALSRGAAHATFVEKNHQALAALRQNIATLGANQDTTIAASTVESFATETKFDLIFADPPYDKISLPALAGLAGLLSPGGILVISHPANFQPEQLAVDTGLKIISTKTYAAAHLSVFSLE